MTAKVEYPTKKALREAIKANPRRVWINDPSIINPRMYTVSSMKPGDNVYVTNEHKHSWFGHVICKADGSILVL